MRMSRGKRLRPDQSQKVAEGGKPKRGDEALSLKPKKRKGHLVPKAL